MAYIPTDWVLAGLQVFLGALFTYYGWPKIKDLKQNAKDFEGMGFKPGWFWGTPIAFLEFVGGILMLAGVYPAIIAALYAAHMLTGTVWKIGFTDKGFRDWSYDVALLAIALVIVSLGPGYALF